MRKIIKNNWFIAKLAFQVCPNHIVLSSIIAILNSCTSILNILVLMKIVDAISSSMHIYNCIKYILVIGSIDIVMIMLQTAFETYFIPRNEQIIQSELRQRIMQKAISLEMFHFDRQNFFDMYSMSISQAETRAVAVLNTLCSLMSQLISAATFAVLLINLDAVLILFAISGATISMIIQKSNMKAQHDYVEETIPCRRQMTYLQRITYLKEDIQEIKQHSCFGNLIKRIYRKSLAQMLRLIKKYAKVFFRNRVISGSVSSLVSLLSLLYLTIQIFTGMITVGAFIALENSTTQLYAKLRALFENVFQLYEHSLYIENYLEFMSVPIKQWGAKDLPKSPSINISIQGLNFSYSGSGSGILHNISLEIKQGEKIVLVGKNGSGKTTLMKCILGLYSPTQGKILVNGTYIEEYSHESYLNLFGTVLQDFRFFALSIAENILMRPIFNKSEDESLVWNALSFVKLDEKIRELPQTIYTPLSREFDSDGAVFSGGELQRLAIARAYAKDAPVLILDEPVSALDPLAEKEIIDMMFAMSVEKTVIIISHRLENVRRADRILVMDRGKIVEEGTHDSLLAKAGLYAKLLKSSKLLDKRSAQ